MTNNTINLWVGNLGKYNEGELVGEWFTLPVEWSEIAETIGLNAEYEEHYIGDYEAPFEISEFSNIEKLNEIAELLEGMDEEQIKIAGELLDNHFANTFQDALEMIENGEIMVYNDCNNMADVAYSWIHEHVGSLEDAVSADRMGFYIDADAIKRDLDIDGYEDEELDEHEKDCQVEQMIEEGIFSGENYFDYEAFGRDMEIEGSFIYVGQETYIQVWN